ncbi:S1C family serine protease [Spartinivicinus poritis]|uniref:Do family serine endopeptidase n=1 Tax=Spartinivicinus poritis TaxID=2994640 RepID=A0ABT5U3R4_9GAMM|nr:Do family serine endopeptidase [Spartinivicinus sp. A2-2]MDE1460606.1 Do family serine endopeptidase [Spartinivicinus sp. A2-2]
MKKLTKFLTWPTISGVLLALVILQQFPELTRKSSTPTPHLTQVDYSDGVTPASYTGDNSRAPSTNHKTDRASTLSGPVSYNLAVKKAAPAVVNIYTTKIIREHRHPIFDDPFFRDFFGYDQMPNHQRMQSSLGSGVIMSPEGYVVTNNHVIQGADEIIVALQDGRDTRARVIGTDPDTDLAVLKIDMKNLPAITLARSRNSDIGDVVLAIGNPFGVGQTVTMGIISATGRNKLRLSTYEDFIQTDAAINPGNSGGALINAFGDLIGINTAIFSKSGGSQGIGFAIPSEIARDVMLSIVKHGKVIRGWLGIEAQSLTPELADAFGLKNKDGILITGVYRNGPAHQAGLQRGDIITEINGMSTKAGRKVMQQVALMQPGEQVVIKAIRNGQKLVVESVIGQRPSLKPRTKPRR